MPFRIDALRREQDEASTAPIHGAGEVGRERLVGYIALVFTVVFFAGAEWHTAAVVAEAIGSGDTTRALLAVLFAAVLLTLFSGSVLYEVCRFGYLHRVPSSDEDRFAGWRELVARDEAPSVLMLIPSYKEEPLVVRQALLSAMLQDHANRRIVLLIDDPS